MTEAEIKQQICDIGKRIYDRGMVASNDGNISVKISTVIFPLNSTTTNFFAPPRA